MMKKLQLLFLLLIFNFSISNAATPWLHVDGNLIKDPAGNTVVLRGVSLQEIGGQKITPNIGINGLLDKLTDTTNTEASVNGWYTRVVRFPISGNISDFKAYYDTILKPAVDYATKKGLYVIIDNHFIADVQGNDTYTTNLWDFIAPLFRDYSNVLFEIYNEPINNVSNGWTVVKLIMQNWVNVIRKNAPNNLILVGNPLWDQRPGDAATSPLTGGNLVYVSHLYPGHWTTIANRTQVQNAVKLVPVILSEWGFYNATPTTTDILKGTITNYGKPIITWADSLGVSWTGWCADDNWLPAMFNAQWQLKFGEGEMGGFTKQKLYDLRTNRQPANIPCVAPYLGADKTICSNIPLSITTGLSATGKTFRWYQDGVLLASETGPSLSAVSVKKGLYRVEVDTVGCTMKDEMIVVDTMYKVALTPSAVLADSILLVAGDPAAGYTYKWYRNDSIISSATSNTLKVLDTCTTIFSVKVSYTGCGTSTGKFEILCPRGIYPKGGAPVKVPGTIQAENYDYENITDLTYHDADAANQGGKYRTDAVDIESCTDAGTGFSVGYIVAGEWMEYSIDVAVKDTTVKWAISFRIASASTAATNVATGGKLHVTLNGIDITGPVTIPVTGGWQTWKTVVVNGLRFGPNDTKFRLYADIGDFNINYMKVDTGHVTPAGINEVKNIPSITIYPNPGTNEVNISIADGRSYDWKISNILGAEMLHGKGNKADISSLQTGPYFLIIEGKAFKILKW